MTVGSELSVIELFINANLVVKYIVILLLSASVFSWSIAFYKIVEFRSIDSENKKFIRHFRNAKDIADFSRQYGQMPTSASKELFAVALTEWRDSTRNTSAQRKYLADRIQLQLSISLREYVKKWESYLATLATIGSSSPFIGLLGTVWGIMNSFRAIAVTKQSSLAIVAPGIAEALFATGIGLFAAIPASIFYNYFVTHLKQKSITLENFADEIDLTLSRYFDHLDK